MVHVRVKGLELEQEKWVNILPSVLKKYNNTKHSTTGMPPSIAGKPENRVQVYLNIKAKAQFKRQYPDIKINSKVRVYLKPKTFKERLAFIMV